MISLLEKPPLRNSIEEVDETGYNMRRRSKQADAEIGNVYDVTDDKKGFIYLVDYMGVDKCVVDAARVSYGKGTRVLRDDAGLIDFCLRNRHTSPFEHVKIKIHACMPIFVARQWIRHRMANINEMSARYSILPSDFYIPDFFTIENHEDLLIPEDIQGKERDELKKAKKDSVFLRAQDGKNRQGSQGYAEIPAKLMAEWSDIAEQSFQIYEQLIAAGVSKELARIHLPLSIYTQWYWTCDLHNLMHFFRLRMDDHAQIEIRQFANALYWITKEVFPLVMASFDRHVLGVTDEEVTSKDK